MARKYRCPYCNKTFERVKLSSHIDKVHHEMLNDDNGNTANRIVFDICNNKEPIGAGSGRCQICKKPTTWNEELVRYNKYCSDTCKAEAREQYKKNMLRVRGTYNLLEDPEWQESKMLANRGISGKYRWSDGTYKTYVGSYEKKFLEFCDNVLRINSEDLITPGPQIEYEYNGKKHIWITDAIYLPYNLVFDIKDGGDNKNKRDMPEYRNKQLYKEKFITDQGVYSYIRLTNNEFVQLLTIFAELKESYLENDELRPISRIHEHMGGAAIGGLPNMSDDMPRAYIINYMKKDDTFCGKEDRGYVLSNDISSEFVIGVDDDGKLKKMKASKKLDEATCISYRYLGDDVSEKLQEVYNRFKDGSVVHKNYLLSLFSEFDEVLSDDQIQFSTMLEEVDLEKLNEQYHTNISTLEWQHEHMNIKPIVFPILEPEKYEYKKSLLREYKDITILQSFPDRKYFAMNTVNQRRTRGVDSIYDITEAMLNTVR